MPDRLVAVLRFEARHQAVNDDTRTALVRQAFGCSLLRYRQRLLAAIEHPGALTVEPQLVAHLREVLSARHARHTIRLEPRS